MREPAVVMFLLFHKCCILCMTIVVLSVWKCKVTPHTLVIIVLFK
jgi:hypothetical protein